MGPVMNLALAVVLLAIVLAQGAEVPAFQDQPPVIGAVADDSPAARAGLRPGDRIVAVDGIETDTWDRLFMAIGTRANRDVPLLIERGGSQQIVSVHPEPQTRYEVGDIGVLPDVYPSIRGVSPGEPAEAAGLQAGDVIVAIDGKRMVFAQHVSEAISSSGDGPVSMTVRRDGEERTVAVTPVARGDSRMIGISINNETRIRAYGPIEAIGVSVQRNAESSVLILQTLWGLVVGDTSPRQLMGPVGIAQLSGESASRGWVELFGLMAMISLNLGLLNLLPIPILDGGHITILALEGVARRDFSMQVKEKMLLAGFVLLMLLMVTVVYNDLTRIAWIEQLMPWRN